MSQINELPFLLTADEQDAYFDLLTSNKTHEQFRFVPNKTDRKERFFGHTIGSCGNELPQASAWKPLSRTIRIEREDYRANDMQGPSRPNSFDDLEKCPRGKDLISAIETWLRKESGSNGDGFLQCNANLYMSGSGLSWHRDDITPFKTRRSDDGANSSSSEPEPPTFWNAAVTVVLVRKVSSNSNMSSFALATLEGHKDCPYGKYASARYRALHNGDKSGARFERITPGTFDAKIPVDLEPQHNYKTGVPLGIRGFSYKFGLHTAVIPITGSEGETWSRLSLNFRIVKSEAWRAIDRVAKYNRPCTIGASCWHKLPRS